MIVDCRSITEELKGKLRTRLETSNKILTLAIFRAMLGDPMRDAQTDAFLKQKEQCGKEVGINVRVYPVDEYMESQSTLEKYVSSVVGKPHVSAAIVQLPLPTLKRTDAEGKENVQAVLNKIFPEKDADVLHYRSFGRFEAGMGGAVVPPNVAAVGEVLSRYAPSHAPDFLRDGRVDLTGKHVVIVGKRSLVVGMQMRRWFMRFRTVSDTALDIGSDIAYYTKKADLVVSCTGRKHIIKPDMVQDGVVIMDFGGSRDEAGKVVGDVDPDVAGRARLMTPVPGGVGPLAVVKLFENVARLNDIRV